MIPSFRFTGMLSRIFAAAMMLCIVMIAAPAVAGAQTTITTVDGKEYVGTVVDEGADAVTLAGTDSTEVKIPRTRIRSVVYGGGGVAGPGGGAGAVTPVVPASAPTTALIEEPVPEKENFPILGGALGTPAGLNLIAGYYFGGFGVRFSGMYLSTIHGFQIDFLRNIGRSKTFSHNIHVGAGISHMELPSDYSYLPDEIHDWSYLTLGYDLNWSEFHLAAGLSTGSGSFSNPQLMLQFGYVHEFK
jgi:hypothetical protein